MPRDLPIGNGSIYIAYDLNGLVKELCFPFVGEENHTKDTPFQFGIKVGEEFLSAPSDFEIRRNYLEDTLVTNIEFHRENLILTFNDLVDFEENIYLKKITLKNTTDKEINSRIYLGHDFHIYGNDIGDTAAYKPENQSLIHYKNERYFLINVLANHKFGIDFFTTGNKGTWKEAANGHLSGNPIAQGSVDSVISIPLTVGPNSEEVCYYWIAMGKNWEEVKALDKSIRKKTPPEFFRRTLDFWKLWVNKEKINFDLLSKEIGNLYKRSLLICQSQINNCGSIIAAIDSDAIYFNRDTYSYMWPRDGALVAYGLDLSGYQMNQFYLFCAKILEKDGYFLHKYTPCGSLGSSWHPWQKGGREQLPIQEDETALVIWSLWKHFEIYKDVDFIRPLYNCLVRKAADFMMNYRDLHTGLPLPSFDLWEERQGVLTFTVSAVFGGLMAASNFAQAFGEVDLAKEYLQGANKMREAMEKHLYLPEKKRFARMVNFKEDGEIEIDATIDASLYALFAFGAYLPEDEKVKSTMEQLIERLSIGEGICRYENDSYFRKEDVSNPWIITTLWKAQYFIAKAKTKVELEESLKTIEWVTKRALPSGCLAEQIDAKTNAPTSVSPLTWSHGTYITTIKEYLNKLKELEK